MCSESKLSKVCGCVLLTHSDPQGIVSMNLATKLMETSGKTNNFHEFGVLDSQRAV